MTAIDGARCPGAIRNVPGPTLDRIDELTRILGRSPAEVVVLAVDKFAPPVETRSYAAASPGDRAGHRGVLPAPVAASSALPHPCVTCGERSIHEECQVTNMRELVNEYAHQLDIVESERDTLKLEADEAAAAVESLAEFGRWLAAEHAKVARIGDPVCRTLAKVITRYAQIEGST